RAFALRCFRLVFEHREESRRTADGTCVLVGGLVVQCVARLGLRISRLPRLVCAALEHSALLIHFFSGVLIQQHIRRKTTACGSLMTYFPAAIEYLALRYARLSATRTILPCSHPACVDV